MEVFGEAGAEIKKNVGPDGALFGSVTPTEVAELLRERAGVEVEKRHIAVPDLKRVGEATAKITLHKEVVSELKIVVVPA